MEEEIDFRKLLSQMHADAIEEELMQLSKENPVAFTFFETGRMLGRFDIVKQLLDIISQESKKIKMMDDLLKGKNDE